MSGKPFSREDDQLSRYLPGSRLLSARRNLPAAQPPRTPPLGRKLPRDDPHPAAASRKMAGPEPPLPRGGPGSASLSPPRGDRTLLVRHLPAELTAEEKEDLLKYFGAQSVRVLSDKGRLVSGGWRGRRAGVKAICACAASLVLL